MQGMRGSTSKGFVSEAFYVDGTLDNGGNVYVSASLDEPGNVLVSVRTDDEDAGSGLYLTADRAVELATALLLSVELAKKNLAKLNED